jgi:uncharacterized protein involved in exopolysaccharide biosynthesis
MNDMTGRDAPHMHNPLDVAIGEPPRAHVYDYLIVLARHRWRILAVVVVGSLLVAGYTAIQPQTYTAAAILMPPERAEGMSFTELLGKSAGFDLGGLAENSTSEVLIAILRSRRLSDSLIDRLGLLKRYDLGREDRQIAMQTLQTSLDISADRHGIITINFDAETGWLSSSQEQRQTAEFAASVANAAHEVLDNLSREMSVSSARLSREFIGRMRGIKRRELDSVQQEYLRFQESNKAIALDKQVEASVTALAEIQSQIQLKDLELQTALNELNPNTPRVESLQSQLARLRQQKTLLESGRAGSAPFAINMASVPELTRQYANLKLDLEVATEVYTFLEAQYHREQVQEARDLPTVTVLDRAVAPKLRSAPRRAVAVLIAAIVLLVIAVLGAFIVDGVGRQLRVGDDTRVEELRAALRRRRRPRVDVAAGPSGGGMRGN